ncbi:MAG TPA: bifunctional DNA-formamidopyrimidine glycosylase/DNA-(apurinic or apyrimidinic site) lyase [Pelagibacteraceae bacterium]|jgi:formamidopyrimidine-DNA glycosylase|nr:bifunctional DNA-formamidopyrimidine glycosylase/DNA-(apurinic or apyrimidinic site) lyase [Pelagibacteraceae bacterium]
MPELPEIEIVKRSLFKKINGAKIVNVKINNKNLRYKITDELPKKLINEKILKISRRSKYLIFHFKNKLLLAHLGMSGKFLIIRSKDKKMFKTSFYYDLDILAKHNHIHFILNNGLELIYNDVRRFGFFKLFENIKLKEITYLKKLGPEPFSVLFCIKYVQKFIKNRKKNIKNLLMDQTFVSGLGNIYVNEALFLSKIHPLRQCSNLERKSIKNLIYNIRKVLKIAINQGGSSIRDFKNVYGKSGNFQQFFNVYGQENKNCSRISCKGKIKKISISNRSSFYCNVCQN